MKRCIDGRCDSDAVVEAVAVNRPLLQVANEIDLSQLAVVNRVALA